MPIKKICGYCKKEFKDDLLFNVDSFHLIGYRINLDFCSADCLAKWVNENE